MEQASNLVQLAAALMTAKTIEGEAKGARIAAEDALVAATGFAKPEGQESYEESGDMGSCKLVVKQPINTRVDDDAWVALRQTLGVKHAGRKVFKASYKLDTKAARELQESLPLAWAQVSSVITRKPGKVAVEVKQLVLAGTTAPNTEVNHGN